MTETEGSRTDQTHSGSMPWALDRPIIPILRAAAYHIRAGSANTECQLFGAHSRMSSPGAGTSLLQGTDRLGYAIWARGNG